MGFIVPIVNLWFPYQVAVDCLPPGDATRSTVGWWWTCWLLQSFAGIPVGIAIFVAPTQLLVPAVVIAAVFPLLAAYTGRKMIATIGQAHESIIASTPR